MRTRQQISDEIRRMRLVSVDNEALHIELRGALSALHWLVDDDPSSLAECYQDVADGWVRAKNRRVKCSTGDPSGWCSTKPAP